MNTPPAHQPDDQPVNERPPSPAHPARRIVGYTLALLLLAGAMWVIWNQRSLVGEALASARSAPPWMLGVLVLLPVAGWITTSLSLWLLTLRFGRVGAGEMLALIGSAMLLNYLPMRPGMVGRIAYHRKVNDIRVRDSARVLIEGTALTGLSAGMLLGIALLLVNAPDRAAVIAAVLSPMLLLALAAVLIPRSRRSLRLVFGAAAVRYADMLVWVVRYLVVFAALGHPLSLGHAVLIAAASQLALLVPLVPGGLGLREWAVGLAGRSVAGGLGGALACDLVNRACEIVVAIPIGLVCMGYIAKRTKQD